MIENFKDELQEDRRTVKWFYDTYVKPDDLIGYSGLCAQLNGYAGISEDVKKAIDKYLSDKRGFYGKQVKNEKR